MNHRLHSQVRAAAVEVAQLMPKDPSQVVRKLPNYSTEDIIKAVLDNHSKPDHANDTAKAVSVIKRLTSSRTEQVYLCWAITRELLKYDEDPTGSQYVFNPDDAVQHCASGEETDCKTYTLFCTSLLRNLGIDYTIKFVSYDANSSKVTHVYCQAKPENVWMSVDTTIAEFATEVIPFYHPKIFYMNRVENAGLVQISGASKRIEYKPTMLQVNAERPISEAELQTRLFIQNRNIMRDLVAQKRQAAGKSIDGIGSPVLKIDEEISEANKVLGDILTGDVAGIGRKADKKKGKAKQILQNIADKVKQGTKGVVHLATAPARLAMKTILEKLLPSAAPMFLYLFVNDMNLIRKLPAKVRAKRKRAEMLMNFVVRRLEMSQQTFMLICRNGILKRYGKQPETVIAEAMRGKVSGAAVGVIPPQVIQAAVQLVAHIVKFIVQRKKDKASDEADNITDADAPDLAADFAAAPGDQFTTTESLSTLAGEVKTQPDELNEEPSSQGAAQPGENGGSEPTVRKTGWC